MYRSVMLPLDGSPFGEHALQLATAIAQRFNARLDLVHVHNPSEEVVAWEPVTPYRYENVERSEREWDSDELVHDEQYLTTKAEAITGCVTTCKVVKGDVVHSLRREIRDRNPDLVVMATHGRSGFSRAWLGSVADELVRSVHTPILLVRSSEENLPPTKFDHVLIPLDGSMLSESIVPHAIKLAELVAKKFTLLRVVPPVWTAPEVMSEPDTISEGALTDRMRTAHDYLETVARLMQSEGVEVNTEVVVGTAAAATILDYSRRRGADVVAMATHGRGGLQRLILGSVADKVIRGASTPILLYHPAFT